MEKLMENLNLFDIIAMLIPGVAFILSTRIALYSVNSQIIDVLDDYTFIAILIFGYIFGFAFQEVGYLVDKKFLHNKCYGGKLKEIFLLDSAKEKIFDNEIYYQMGQAVKKDIIGKSKTNTILKCDKTWSNEKQLNRFIYNFLLDYLEIHGLKDKSDKMQVLTELSRSLMIISTICAFDSILNIVISCLKTQPYVVQSIINCGVFSILAVIFCRLKVRYEKYRIRTMIRIYFINNLKSEGL